MTCATLISHLDDAEYMISRFKSENVIISYLEHDEESSSTRKLKYFLAFRQQSFGFSMNHFFCPFFAQSAMF